MNWEGYSEVVAGLILSGKYASGLINHENAQRPYDEIIRMYKENASKEEIILRVGYEPIEIARMAADAISEENLLVDWSKLLRQAHQMHTASIKLKKVADRLSRGDAVDWLSVIDLANRAQVNQTEDFVSLADTKGDYVPFMLSGWDAIDDHLGGIPQVGLITVAGRMGIGKTTLVIKLIAKFIKHHADKVGAIFTLEMMREELALRMRDTNKITDEEETRLLLCDHPVTPEEVIIAAGKIKNLGIVVVDFADKLIKGEVNDSSMGHVYNVLSTGAKQLRVPVVLVAHTNRNHQANGGLPRPHYIRYTGVAENLSWMLLMPYNPNEEFGAAQDSGTLPIRKDVAYVCCWKVRGGFRKHVETSPGAIAIPFRGDMGWYDTSLPGEQGWISLRNAIS